ncbi:hypothetical protein UNPF46_29950 [Bradyrhizobium sp. UNPF46]|uniref:restriction endonuclease n=1 Tax=Bradyrhizobium sp. UNPF46 TaxID=1141168 RepID=UPI0011510CDC|nr:restriction endonuclease [Bradyrhizobium sp. UNPF46]TQF27560.1 hypothetical protein UNPF46_29950 [Bradyrhizobium sp. UNPF46]
MARKAAITRTFGPIHFEDLDPHRFEDLVRELIYDFRQWQSIEATGRAGGDAGFDIRAFEKLPSLATDSDEDEPVEPQHPMEGPRWMIQVKREKTITPSDVRKILSDVDPGDPPYGYILAASAVFSKPSYDLFRAELRKKGVMEFYLWGRPELEDMLHLPKNDRILFTFFGISLVSRRRARSTEIRTAVNTKNKLYTLLGDPHAFIDREVLIRDINDLHYPYADEYPDFKKRPRWIYRTVVRHHPKGLLVQNREFFAFVDKINKEWDFTDHANRLVLRRKDVDDEERKQESKKVQEVHTWWDFLPRSQRGSFEIVGFLPYSDIALIDAKGDGSFECPHLYVEFSSASGPYAGFYEKLTVGGEKVPLDDSWRRISFFPKPFQSRKIKRRIHRDRKVALASDVLSAYLKYELSLDELAAIDGRYDFLRQGDVVFIEGAIRNPHESERAVEVRHVFKGRLGDYLADQPERLKVRHEIQRQVTRDVTDDQEVVIVEIAPTWLKDDD